MSFSLEVYAPAFPDDVVVSWRQALQRTGLAVEFYPQFAPATWSGGFLPVKLAVEPGAFEQAARYGSEPILAGFEITFRDAGADAGRLAIGAPPEAAAALRKCRRVAWLTTAMGRTVADLRLQCFAAAALAHVTGGVVMDGQQGRTFVGDAAITNAARESDDYEAHSSMTDWDLIPFPGWAVLDSPEAS